MRVIMCGDREREKEVMIKDGEIFFQLIMAATHWDEYDRLCNAREGDGAVTTSTAVSSSCSPCWGEDTELDAVLTPDGLLDRAEEDEETFGSDR
jgi:hypothetical protein